MIRFAAISWIGFSARYEARFLLLKDELFSFSCMSGLRMFSARTTKFPSVNFHLSTSQQYGQPTFFQNIELSI